MNSEKRGEAKTSLCPQDGLRSINSHCLGRRNKVWTLFLWLAQLRNLLGPSSLFDKGDFGRMPKYWNFTVPSESNYTYDVLKKLGSPVSTRIGNDQWTPKLWAARNNRFEAAKLLMEMEMNTET